MENVDDRSRIRWLDDVREDLMTFGCKNWRMSGDDCLAKLRLASGYIANDDYADNEE